MTPKVCLSIFFPWKTYFSAIFISMRILVSATNSRLCLWKRIMSAMTGTIPSVMVETIPTYGTGWNCNFQSSSLPSDPTMDKAQSWTRPPRNLWAGWPGAGIMEADDRQVTTVFSATVIPPSPLDKLSTMKHYHHWRMCSHTSPRCLRMMVTLHDTWFVKCRFWNDGWTVNTVVTWRSSASMIRAPELCSFMKHIHHEYVYIFSRSMAKLYLQ